MAAKAGDKVYIIVMTCEGGRGGEAH